MAGEVTTSVVAAFLRRTLMGVMTDKSDKMESSLLMTKYLDAGSMEHAYEDDQEVAGPGLASERNEGADIVVGTIKQGFSQRYIARMVALSMIVTQEALEDNKYPEAIGAARRIKRSLFQTMDYDAANILIRAFNTAYVGGDSVALGSASHPLAQGGTFSNIMGTPAAPSRLALQTALTSLAQMPGHDGLFSPIEAKKILCPVGQRWAWEGILGSAYVPESNANEINVVAKSRTGIELLPIVYWSNTTTNWAIKTDAEDGLKWLWRRKIKSNSWVDDNNMTLHYSGSYRAAKGWSNPRAFYGVNA